MPGKFLRRLAPAIALAFTSTLLAVTGAGATVVPNPGLPNLTAGCGLDLLLVMDRSGSVQPYESQAETAAKAFLDPLKDTGSKVGIVSFSAASGITPAASVNMVPTVLSSGSLPAFETAINSLTFSGFTNWEAGLALGLDQFGAYDGGRPDLVVVVTDGLPNRYGNNQGSGSDLDPLALNAAVAKADLMQAAGSHIFAVGVGNDVSETALKRVSGDDPWTGANFATADWTLAANYGDLGTKLAAFAKTLCQETVVVHKLLDGEAEEGWEFSATVGQTTASDETNASGDVSFSWSPVSPVDVLLSEESRTGIELDKVECTLNDETINPDIEDGVVSLHVGQLDTIECTFYNKTVSQDIEVVKTASSASASPGDEVTYHYVVTNIGDVALSNVNIDDDILGHIGGPISLAPGESQEFDKVATIEAGTNPTNVVTAAGIDRWERRAEDTDEVTISIVIPVTPAAPAPPADPIVVPSATKPATVLGETLVAAPVVAPAAELPRTGNDPNRLLLLGGISLLAGLAALLVAGKGRRRSIDLG